MDAISLAIKELNKGDVLLIAGKGHETTQLIGKKINYFNDKEVVNEILKLGN